MLVIKRVTEQKELIGIKELLDENLFPNIDKQVAAEQGFLTADYSLDFLERMHNASPSTIAIDGNKVVGYALVALKEVREHHPLLADLFDTIDNTVYNNLFLKNERYVVVGQLCVAREYRGQGLVKRLYDHYRESLIGEYDYCITDVATGNPRSLKVHLSVGFKVIDLLEYGDVSWNILLWDWKQGIE